MMKKTILMMLVIFLLGCASAAAQKVEVFGGYSYLDQNSASGGAVGLNGWAAGVEVGCPKWSHFSLAADFSGTYGTQQFSTIRQTLHQFTYLAGPRVSQRAGRLRIFEHLLIGAAELKGQAARQSDADPNLALALGAGIDVRLNQHLSVRPAQLDYLLTRFAEKSQNSFKYASGIVLRF